MPLVTVPGRNPSHIALALAAVVLVGQAQTIIDPYWESCVREGEAGIITVWPTYDNIAANPPLA